MIPFTGIVLGSNREPGGFPLRKYPLTHFHPGFHDNRIDRSQGDGTSIALSLTDRLSQRRNRAKRNGIRGLRMIERTSIHTHDL
jgi:4'-phosphopantetheinyl transferase EntD